MSSILGRKSIVLAGLVGAAFLSIAPTASAKDHQYCLLDYYSSGTRDCGFDTIEQCLAMISGRGGSCARDPYLPEPRASYAYAQKGRGHRPPRL
jgi:hypothetical protein